MDKLNRILILWLLLCGGLVACKQEDPTPIVPKGDAAQTAREFMSALYGGNSGSCRELSSIENRDQVAALCQANHEVGASITLDETTFVVVYQRGILATVEMRGRWSIKAFRDNGQVAIETHDTLLEPAVELYMIYQDGKWRFDYFGGTE